jgi:hypothetical protein
MSNHENLIWFNKEGDFLNFNYNESVNRFEGDILFHESSTDIYKTYGLYMFEDVPSFDFERPNELTTRKFQLFNERGIHFYGTDLKSQDITKIEPVNNDVGFYSKWIYGDDFQAKFPIGTIVSFDNPFLEFNNPNKTYVVSGNKSNAILILSQVDNKSFEIDYQQLYENENSYINQKLSGVNCIGVYDYIDIETYKEKLSDWSEPEFYDKYFIGKKLNIINSKLNDKVVTVDNTKLIDLIHYEYLLHKDELPDDKDFIIEVISKTDLPRIYNGGIVIDSDSRINIDPNFYPAIIKPGTEFKIEGSINSVVFLRVSDLRNWDGILTTTDFIVGDQVTFNNRIFQCKENYVQSFSNIETSSITPSNSEKWGRPDYIKIEQILQPDNISLGQLYLTTDRFYFTYSWDTNKEITLASAIEKYKDDLNLFNIDLYYENNQVNADLVYPSQYANVNFYHTEAINTNKIGGFFKAIERLVGVGEDLDYELNYNNSELFDFKIVFTDIDEFGIKVNINGMIYEEEVSFIFSGKNSIDVERTIDRTLRNWLSRNYIELFKLGIDIQLRFSGNTTSLFYNSIRVLSQYPNVPVSVDDVLVGTTANYYIEHSRVLFRDLGGYLDIRINGISYGVQTIYNSSTNIPDVISTISKWVREHNNRLNDFGIIVKNINQLLIFDIKDLKRRLDYTITTGKVNIPGLKDFEINNLIKGNEGVIISSNEILLPRDRDESLEDFEEYGFATGMALSINNTIYSLVNQEYTIQYLDPLIMNISYEGPFWGLTSSICNSSAFVTLAFDNGYGLTGCGEPLSPDRTITSPFNTEFRNLEPDNNLNLDKSNSQFKIDFNANDYEVIEFDLNRFSGADNMVDIIYIQNSNSIYTLADSLIVHNASTSNIVTIIDLINNNGSIKLKYNNINNYLYALTINSMYIINPLTNMVIGIVEFQNNGEAFDIDFNPLNGDVYVTFSNLPEISIWGSINLSNIPSRTIDSNINEFPLNVSNTKNIVFNDFEGDMYVSTDNGFIIRINSNRTIQNVYDAGVLKSELFYEPVEESIYFFTDTHLSKIDNGVLEDIEEYSNDFNEILFNNLTGNMNISTGSSNDGDFLKVDIISDSVESYDIDTYGFLGINQFDGDVYLTSQTLDVVYVINPINGTILHTQNLTSGAPQIINNPERNSMWAIQPSNKRIIEMSVEVNTTITPFEQEPEVVGENLYGTLNSDYVKRESMWLKTKDYIRKPRENFEGDTQVSLYWKWEDNQTPEFFIYDFTGDQLENNGSYSYTGIKPFDKIVLNKSPNKDINRINQPEFQQTIFDKISYELPFIDDQRNVSTDVEPLELFLGYKSTLEGAYQSILKLYKKESVRFDIESDSMTDITLEIIEGSDRRGIIYLNNTSPISLSNRGLKPEQLLVLYLNDISNESNQYTSVNNASVFKIRQVFSKSIIIDFINSNDFISDENTVIDNYPSVGDTTYLSTTFKIIDKEIGRFNVYGQTEDEDERFKINLANEGKLIGPDEVFIFKQYDIQEGGIDWTFLNKKRKEMLMMKQLIYPYIGAYKSIINAINFFGYNDLQLNEYYRNVNPESESFSKLFKVEIPDIFDNSTEGWDDNDFIKNTYPNTNFEETKLFNLTYKITDKEGNRVINYTLDEVIIKLQGLKYWLKNNIIPLTHKIEDITGLAYVKTSNYIQHRLHDIRIINIKENMTPISCKMNEAYLMPINSGSTVYNCAIDFYSIVEGIGKSDYTTEGVKAYDGFKLEIPDSFDIEIRTYKTYKEWEPFSTYNRGDKVRYLDFLYESVIDFNRTNNPSKYNTALPWSPNINYKVGSIVLYNNNYYSLRTSALMSSTPPLSDSVNWLKISQWIRISLEPVQTVQEFRKGSNLLPYSFTIDSNIDPFITIEVTSDNGYGEIYRDRRNYELKGANDLGLMSVNQVNLPTLRSPLTPIFDVPTDNT